MCSSFPLPPSLSSLPLIEHSKNHLRTVRQNQLIGRAFFLNASIRYIRHVPKKWRRYLELFLAIKALLCYFLLLYYDRTLSMNILDKPTTKTQSCFKIPQNITGLMNHGVLRLDVIRDIGEKGYYKLEDTGRCPSNPFSLSCTGWFLNDKIRGEMP